MDGKAVDCLAKCHGHGDPLSLPLTPLYDVFLRIA